MKTIEIKTSINRWLAVLVIYALFINELVPFSRAMNSIEFMGETKVGRLYDFDTAASKDNEVEKVVEDTHEFEEIPLKLETEKLTNVSMANSGPGQAETSGFSINSTDGMVDKFTGDFSYSIPLMDVEGYPIVISYNSNVTMLQEASWVGLGWNLNVGAISREMRGIPDDFNGEDEIVRTFNQKNNSTTGSKKGGYSGIGIVSKKRFVPTKLQLTFLAGKYTDELLGLGKTYDLGLQAQYSIAKKGLFLAPTFNLGFNYDSKSGIGRPQIFGLSGGYGHKEGMNTSITYGRNFNSRYGIRESTISFGMQTKIGRSPVSYSANSSITYGSATSIPRVQMNTDGTSDNTQFSFDNMVKLEKLALSAGFIRQEYTSNSALRLIDNQLIQPAYGYLHSGKRSNEEDDSPAVMDFNRGQDSEFSEEMKNLPFSVQTHDIFYANASGLGGTFRPMRKDYGTYYDARTESLFNEESKLLVDDNQTNTSTGVVYDVKKPTMIGFSVGYSTGIMKGDVNSGHWKENGTTVLKFDEESPKDHFDGSVYFRSVGEHTPVDMSAWEEMNGNTADFFDVNAAGDNIDLTNSLKVKGQTGNAIPDQNIVNNSNVRTHAATVFQPVIAGDLTGTPDAQFKSYITSGSFANTTENRVDGVRREHHISQVNVVTPAGVRYKYGIPVFNKVSSEVSFASEGLSSPGGVDQGLVKYQAGVDNSISNTRGRSNYYDKTDVPAYAHSFLLTEMTSSDYIDRNGDGPSLDDIGTWYKFNHTRLYGNVMDNDPNTADDAYKWRFPMSGGTDSQDFPNAKRSRGVLGSTLDDMAHYSYGEKEIWYTHSIESKNMIAEFHLLDREDAYGVQGENGVLDDDKPLKKLDKIVLYSRSEKLKDPNNAQPLQVIKFEYDYSLCQKAPGNPATYNSSLGQSGKLTLKSIRVYSGTSKEQALTSYSFDYGDVNNSAGDNPDFNYYHVDAWGNHKPSTTDKPNDVFPYGIQDEALANQYAQAWKLKTIENPMGGKMEITYEADRYGYVQHKRAMRHFDIHGMLDLFKFLRIKNQSDWNPAEANNEFHTDYDNAIGIANQSGIGGGVEGAIQTFMLDNAATKYMKKFGKYDPDAVPNNIIVFELETPISGASVSGDVEASAIVKEQYFKASGTPNDYLKELLFKVHASIKSNVDELIPVTATISQDYTSALDGKLGIPDDFTAVGVMPKTAGINEYQYGYVVLDPVNTGDREKPNGSDKIEKGSLTINPLQLASLEFARQYLLDKVYGSCDGCDPDLSIDWKVFFGHDMYKYMIQNGGYAKTWFEDFTTVRLAEPDGVKFGGNARVKSIKYSDNWDGISGEYGSDYVWNYDYRKVGEDGRLVETGVASFEGRGGIDENALYKWDSYVNIKKKFPDERKFTPTPVAEQLYPRPVVGYEQVTVTFQSSVNYGRSISSFHTNREEKYRTKSRSAGEYGAVDNSAHLKKRNILSGSTVDVYGLTQGYVVETNDFHGKPNEVRLIDKNGNLISRSKYNYFELGEKVPMVNRQGQVFDRTIATEYDIHADSRYVSDKTKYREAGIKFTLFYTPPTAFNFDIGPIVAISSRERGFYSHTLLKHINYSAVVKDIETEYLGSVNTARNILYDEYTGKTILSSLKDEFDDELFNLSYPSHWKFKELRELHEAERYTTITVDANGNFDPAQGGEELSPGDRIENNGINYIVAQAYPVPQDGKLFLTYDNGSVYNGPTGQVQMTILESNRDNRLTESMQSVVSKKIPFDATPDTQNFGVNHKGKLITPTEVLSSSAIEYRDRLNFLCGPGCNTIGDPHSVLNNNEVEHGSFYNPYDYGIRGDLIVDGQFAWQDSLKGHTHEHGIRFDGEYHTFVPYYDLGTSSKWESINDVDHPAHDPSDPYKMWRKLGRITMFDQFGKGIESVDQIGVHSSVLYGYNGNYNLLPVAQAVNARKQEIAFDGFEDYAYLDNVRPECDVAETHFDYVDQISPPGEGIEISTTVKHSGLHSLRLEVGKSASVRKDVDPDPCIATEVSDVANSGIQANSDCACVKKFSPTPGKYIVGAWVHQPKGFTGGQLKIRLVTNTPNQQSTMQLLSFQPSGDELDGWQRLEGTFTIPSVPSGSTMTIDVILENGNATGDVHFDDIRIHPFLAGMTTVVYDPKTLLPLATHDGYNFTTFYNYDENLNQVRMRVETVEGIKTIIESEAGGQKF